MAGELASYRRLRAATAYELLRDLRPEYLANKRGTAGAPTSAPIVIVNEVTRGGVELLQALPALLIAEVRLVRPRDAFIRYGADYRSGVVLITTTVR